MFIQERRNGDTRLLMGYSAGLSSGVIGYGSPAEMANVIALTVKRDDYAGSDSSEARW
jgi:hypothetical protein